MSVAEINALLYSPNHARDRLERALRIEALSPGWRASFALLQSPMTAVGLATLGSCRQQRRIRLRRDFSRARTAVEQESADVLSLSMRHPDNQPLQPALPGQYVVVRLGRAGDSPLFRSYSLSDPLSTERHRISVKIEPNGVASI
jgi:hypothetical protein